MTNASRATKLPDRQPASEPERQTSKFGISLKTLLAATTLAATYFAHVRVTQELAAAKDRLTRASFRAGEFPEDDIDNFQYKSIGNRYQSETGWLIWVPYNKSVRLRIQTNRLENDTSQPGETLDFSLAEGSHRVGLAQENDTWRLSINGTQIFERSENRYWNVSRILSMPIPLASVPSIPQPILLQNAYGKASLEVDEEYDPTRHQFGLRIWLDKAE